MRSKIQIDLNYQDTNTYLEKNIEKNWLYFRPNANLDVLEVFKQMKKASKVQSSKSGQKLTPNILMENVDNEDNDLDNARILF